MGTAPAASRQFLLRCSRLWSPRGGFSGSVGAVKWVALIAGGGLGAVFRYAVTAWIGQRMPSVFPWGTLGVNLIGCLFIGVVATLLDEGEFANPTLRVFAITGLLGAFTTFSTVGLESLRLLESGRLALVFANTVGSLTLGILAVAAGAAIARSFT